MVVGENIRRLRNEHRLTLLEFASQLGISFQQIQKYETGANRISAGVLHHVAQTFCVSVDALFEGVDGEGHSDPAAKALHLARNKCRAIVNRASSVPVLDAMAKVLRVLEDTD